MSEQVAGGRRGLQRRLVALVAVLLALLVVDAVAGAVLDAQRGREQTEVRERLLPAVVAADRLLTAYVDQETGVRGYVLTGAPEFLEPYRGGQQRAADEDAQLRRLLAGQQPALGMLGDVESRAEAWRRGAAEPEVAAREAGDTATASSLPEQRAGKQRFDALRAASSTLQDRLRHDLEDASSRTNRAADRANDVTVVSALLALLATAVLGGQLLGRVLRPVRRLATVVGRTAADPGRGPVVVPGATGELQDVVESTEDLRQVAVDRARAADRAEQAVGQEAPTVLALTGELAPTPADLPGGYVAAGRTQAADGLVAGDLHDVLPLADGRLVVLVVDAAGHGPDAALVALRVKTAVLGALRAGDDPGQALERAARELGDTGEQFVTAFLATVDPPTGALEHASAGHPDALLFPDGAEPVRLDATGPLLGPLPGRWTTRTGELAPGGLLVVVTDGVADAPAPPRGRYGQRRLREVLEQAARRTPADPAALVAQVLGDVERTAGDAPADDRTVLALARRADAPPPPGAAPGPDGEPVWVALPLAAGSAGAARALLRGRLADVDPDLVDAAQLCLTELVTNAVLHAGSGLQVHVALLGDRAGGPDGIAVRVAVHDGAATLPRLTPHSRASMTGRGLGLVAGLSRSWGVEAVPSGGKVVWAVLDARSVAAATVDPEPEEWAPAGPAPAPAGTGTGTGTDEATVRLLRYPVARGMRSREHWASLLRECQLVQLSGPGTDVPRRVLAVAEQISTRYAAQLAGPEAALRTALARGRRAVDLTYPVVAQSRAVLLGWQQVVAELEQVQGDELMLTSRAPADVRELDEWVLQELLRQLDGEPPRPWPGALD